MFFVPDTLRDNKKRLRYAKIKIAFYIKDKPLFNLIQTIIGGVFEIHKNFGVLIINKNKELIFICKAINGFLRTPKINDFHNLIGYLNQKNKNSVIEKLNLDFSPIHSNAWLSGFFEGDGNFSLTITDRKKSKKYNKRIQIQCRLEIKRFYSKKYQEGVPFDYYQICEKISTYWGVGVYSRTRNSHFHALIVSSYSISSNSKVIAYFQKFPLFSSKFLNYVDWKTIYDLQVKKLHLTPEGIDICQKIKKNFNRSRKNFSWIHLKNFYLN